MFVFSRSNPYPINRSELGIAIVARSWYITVTVGADDIYYEYCDNIRCIISLDTTPVIELITVPYKHEMRLRTF